jgi:AmiR/NasT family two-component response regulator
MMSRSGGTVAEAMDRLRELSQAEHRKMAVVAQHIVDEAVRRARPIQPAGENPTG